MRQVVVLESDPIASVNGKGGDDIIEGGSGSDILEGGTGDDRLYANKKTDFDTIFDSDTTEAGDTQDWLQEGLFVIRDLTPVRSFYL